MHEAIFGKKNQSCAENSQKQFVSTATLHVLMMRLLLQTEDDYAVICLSYSKGSSSPRSPFLLLDCNHHTEVHDL